MLHILVGGDRERKRGYIEKLRGEKLLLSELISHTRDQAATSLDELKLWLATDTGLFGERFFVVLEQFFDTDFGERFLVENGAQLLSSETVFVITQDTLKVAQKKNLPVEPVIFDTQEEKGGYSIFALTDAFSARDKKQTWVLLQKALEHADPEEVHGTLWWQVKTILQVATENVGAESLGMKPFVYKKALAALKKFSKEEMVTIAQELLAVYHDAHRGEGDFAMKLEQLVLRRI